MQVSRSKKTSIQLNFLAAHRNKQLISCGNFECRTSEYETDDSFQVSLRRVATFVQFLFLMPVCEISSENPENLHFKWSSWRVILCIFYISYGIFTIILFFRFIHGIGIDTKNIGTRIKTTSLNLICNLIVFLFIPVGLVFFSYTTTCTIIFLDIARKWPMIS